MTSTFEATRAIKLERIRDAITPDTVSHLQWSRNRIEAEQTRKLREVLSKAKSDSPFYAKRLANIDPATFKLRDLSKIEPVTKQDVMENWDDIVTDPGLTLTEASTHLEALRDGIKDNFYLGDNYLSATGGSSGKRGLFVWDDDLFETTSAITYRLEALEDSIRPPGLGAKRTAVICAGSYLHGSRMLFPQSPDAGREVKVFPASLPLNQLVDGLNKYQPDRLVGYSSIVAALCGEAVVGRLDIPLKRVTVNSEPLEHETRLQALEAWGINIHNSWGCVELGVAGVEGEDYDGLILAEDFLIFEAVDKSGKLIDEGEADHMLVTRLFGSSMPLIRYKVTDSPTIERRANGFAPGYRRITDIRGRSDIWFSYNEGIKIHPMIFRSVLGQYGEVAEYQVRQTRNGADIDIRASDAADPPQLQEVARQIEKKICNTLQKYGLEGKEVQVKVAVVGELQRHPETNKLTRFVQLPKAGNEPTVLAQ